MAEKTMGSLIAVIFLSGIMGGIPADSAQRGDTLPEVKIGNQVWMSRNLDVDTFRNGDPIPHAATQEAWQRAVQNRQPAWCYLGNDPAKGRKFGRLYNWYAVNDPRGLAPEGWRIPTVEDWKELLAYLDQTPNISAHELMRRREDWTHTTGYENNASGFTALPGLNRSTYGEIKDPAADWGEHAVWWSTTIFEVPNMARAKVLQVEGFGYHIDHVDKGSGLSVRCIRETTPAKRSAVPPPTSETPPPSPATTEADLLPWERESEAAPLSEIDRLIQRADAGEVEAIFDLVDALMEGEPMPFDEAQALKWVQGAAEAGHAEMQMAMGMIHFEGLLGLPENIDQTFHWLRLSAQQGFAEGQALLGGLYLMIPDHLDYIEGHYWLRRSAAEGNSNAQHFLGFQYAEGLGVPANPEEAVRLWQLSAEQGNEIAAYELAHAYENGFGVAASRQNAVRWYRRAAAGGHPEAAEAVARLTGAR